VTPNVIETDYLIVGAGAAGMAFADTLLTETDARIVIVDRHHRPGGHWNDAYPFVRLHQPSAFYGVNSRELSHGTKDAVGWNKGLYDLAGGAEVLGYFDQLMQQRFLPSGRVKYFPMSNFTSDDGFESVLTGQRYHIKVQKKIVDATYSATAVPATHPPKYAVAPDIRVVPVNDLPKAAQAHSAYLVVGSGKTGIDACLWLLEQGVEPERISWIMPRDAWLLDRALIQPDDEFFFNSFGSLARQFEAVVAAQNLPDLFDRLEAGGDLLRIDPNVRPTVYRCATVSQDELVQLRRVKNIVRLGHVRAVEATRVVLENGELPLCHGTLVVDCSASGIPQRSLVPIWVGKRVTLQMVRTCQPTFSAAFIGHVEAAFTDDAEKNALCSPVPGPYLDIDWLRMLAVSVKNRFAWSQHPGIEQWLVQSRLDRFWASARNVKPEDSEKVAVLQRYRAAVGPAMVKLPQLLANAG
jgi:hypothetical protein